MTGGEEREVGRRGTRRGEGEGSLKGEGVEVRGDGRFGERRAEGQRRSEGKEVVMEVGDRMIGQISYVKKKSKNCIHTKELSQSSSLSVAVSINN